jgi:hypothetical protein
VKSFSKTIIAFALVSLFIVSPLFAEDYVCKIPAGRSNSKSLAAPSSSQVLGPYVTSAIEWVDSTNAKVYLTDSSGKTDCLKLEGPSIWLMMFSSALSNQAIVYLFLDSENYVINVGFVI